VKGVGGPNGSPTDQRGKHGSPLHICKGKMNFPCTGTVEDGMKGEGGRGGKGKIAKKVSTWFEDYILSPHKSDTCKDLAKD